MIFYLYLAKIKVLLSLYSDFYKFLRFCFESLTDMYHLQNEVVEKNLLHCEDH